MCVCVFGCETEINRKKKELNSNSQSPGVTYTGDKPDLGEDVEVKTTCKEEKGKKIVSRKDVCDVKGPRGWCFGYH